MHLELDFAKHRHPKGPQDPTCRCLNAYSPAFRFEGITLSAENAANPPRGFSDGANSARIPTITIQTSKAHAIITHTHTHTLNLQKHSDTDKKVRSDRMNPYSRGCLLLLRLFLGGIGEAVHPPCVALGQESRLHMLAKLVGVRWHRMLNCGANTETVASLVSYTTSRM